MNSAEGGRAPEYFGRNGERKWEYPQERRGRSSPWPLPPHRSAVSRTRHTLKTENATAAVVSDDGSHIVVDVDLNGGASDVGSDRQGAEKGSQGESVSDTETDKTMKAFEGLMTFNVIIITTAFYYMFLPFISAMAMILLLNELLDLHDRRRL